MLHEYDYSPVKYAVAIVTEKGDMFSKRIFVFPNFSFGEYSHLPKF